MNPKRGAIIAYYLIFKITVTATLFGAVLLSTIASAQADAIDISTITDGKVNSPAAAAQARQVYAVWADNQWAGGATHRINFSYSYDRGATWLLFAQWVTNTDHVVANPDVAQDAPGNGYVVWEDYSYGGSRPYIHFAYNAEYHIVDRSLNTAQAESINVGLDGLGLDQIIEWPDDIVISIALTGTHPAIAVNAVTGDAYAVWQAWDANQWDIYFAYATHYTASHHLAWTEAQRINDATSGNQIAPRVAVDELGNAYAVWEDQATHKIRFAYASQYTVTNRLDWSASIVISPQPPTYDAADAREPDLAVDAAGNAYAVWVDDRRSELGDVFFAQATHDEVVTGAAWTLLIPPISSEDTEDAVQYQYDQPVIAVNQYGQVQVVWRDGSGAVWQVCTARLLSAAQQQFAPTASQWDEITPVSSYAAYQGEPAVGVDDLGYSYIVWTDERNRAVSPDDGDIYAVVLAPPPSPPIPTLSEVGLLSFGLIMGGYAWWRLQHRAAKTAGRATCPTSLTRR